jgi:protein-S-isoprenylcysteine O-methyltransferase Ste14
VKKIRGKGVKFREGWIKFLHTVATGTKKTRTLLTPIGVVVFGVFMASFVIFAMIIDRMLNLPILIPESVRVPLSVLVITSGIYITAWSAFHFIKVKGTPVPVNPPPIVVKTGPYRYARNPMLTGVFLLLFGIGFVVNSISLVFFFTPLFILINVWELKRIEEPELIKRLGNEYIVYKNNTPMFFPRFKPKTK